MDQEKLKRFERYRAKVEAIFADKEEELRKEIKRRPRSHYLKIELEKLRKQRRTVLGPPLTRRPDRTHTSEEWTRLAIQCRRSRKASIEVGNCRNALKAEKMAEYAEHQAKLCLAASKEKQPA